MYPHVAMMGQGTFCPEARALFARMSPAPTYARKIVIDRLITTLIRYGLWSKLDVLYLFAGHASAPSLLNWKGATYNATNSGATFTADRGFTGDGASSAILTGYAPGSGQFLLNDHAYGAWVRTAATGNTYATGVGNAGLNGISMKIASSALETADGVLATPDSTSVTTTGHLVASRMSGPAYSTYRAGALLAANTRTIAALPTGNFMGLALNLDSTPAGFTDAQLSALHFGKGLSATDVANLKAALQPYMTAVGA